ncbi:MAG: N-acetylneuraminate synthase family protein [Rhizobiaceae bacterium]|nr:N-acetylneuraminate synthase family protein [Rhizobiaceae bacterium]
MWIGKHKIGDGKRCFVIAEVAQAHDGSLGFAHAFIDAAARAGADAIKFQTHFAGSESTPEEPWRVRFSYQDDLRYDYWKRVEFTPEQWAGLKSHADEKDLVFLSSAFSGEAVALLHKLDMPAWKIASGEINNPLLLDQIGALKQPVLLSSGMSALAETDAAVRRLQGFGAEIAVFQCTSKYPTPPEELGLNMLDVFRQRYDCPVGLSDHSGTMYAGLAAAALGADLLELHITLSREMFGPDVIASVTADELQQLVEGIRFIETARANPVEKNAAAKGFSQMRSIFTKSLFAAVDLPAGKTIEITDLAAKKPGTGLPAQDYELYLGRRAARDILAGHMLTSADFQAD